MRSFDVVVCVLTTASGAAVAQDSSWRLPDAGAAEFRRELNEVSVVASSRALAARLNPSDPVPPRYLPPRVPAPWLCQGELDREQQSIVDPPVDLRDVIRFAALDLRGGRRVRHVLHRIAPFGDLELRGTTDGESSGRQLLELRVVRREPESVPGEPKADLQRYVRPLLQTECQGTLTIERIVDRERGVVSRFDGRLELLVEEQERQFRKIVVRDRWDLIAVHDNQDAAFRTRVSQAITAGAKWVRRELKNTNRVYLKPEPGADRSYNSGRLALGTLTMLKAELPPDDEVVAACLAELRRREIVDTYSLATALMAFEAAYAPPGERDQLLNGVIDGPLPRTPSAADLELITRWTEQLLLNLDSRVDRGYRLRFNYVPGPRFDNSVTQYGLLGLYSAHLCGVPVSGAVWRAAATHLLEVQGPPGKLGVRLQLQQYRDLLGAGDDPGRKRRTRGGAALVAPAGWAYQSGERPNYGGMTVAGITGLTICRAGLLANDLARADVLPAMADAERSGLAWLARHFTVRGNPGFVDRRHRRWYYYMYGLERACELASVARLQGRDWYYEGAIQLLDRQQKNGTFRREANSGRALDPTCFAVLFLKKAALPVPTGKPRR